MLYAIWHVSGAILARGEAPTVGTVADMPAPPDACQWVELTQAQYDALVVPFENHRPAFAWNGADVVAIEYSRHFAIVRSADRAVVALDTNNNGPVSTGQEYVQITPALWADIAQGQRNDDGSPAWNCAADGTVTPRPDARYVLRLTLTGGPVFAPGATVEIAAQLEQADGTPITGAGGTRDISLVRYLDGQPRRVPLSLVNGAASVSAALASGRYIVASGDPANFRVDGDAAFEVADAW